MQTKQFIWSGAGVLVVLILAFGAWWFSQGSVPTSPALKGKLAEAVSSTDWREGAANPKITIVEYSDFECPACAAYAPILRQLVEEFPNDVALVYRHFPLNYHQSAELAATFAEAAGRQDKFWEMHDLLFARQKVWSPNRVTQNQEVFKAYAKELGLDLVKLESDLKDSTILAKIKRQAATGTASGVDGTPSLFVNGERIKNPRSYDELKALVVKN